MSLSKNVALINKITLETAKKNKYSDKAKVVYKEPSGKYWVKPDGFDLPIPAKVDEVGSSYNIDDEVMLNYPNAKISEAIIMCLSQVATPEATDHDFSLYPVTLEENQYLYVIDRGNNRIQKFDLNGNFVSKFAVPSAYWQYINIDSSGNIYIQQTVTNYINKYTSSGTLISSTKVPATASNYTIGAFTLNGNNIYIPGFSGSVIPGLAKYSLDLSYIGIGSQAFGSSGWACTDGTYIYVCCYTKTYKFDTNLNLLATITTGSSSSSYCYQAYCYGGYIYRARYLSSSYRSIVKYPVNFIDGDTITPITVVSSVKLTEGLFVNKKGIFVSYSSGISKYSLSGELQGEIITSGTADGKVNYPTGIFIK